MLPEQTGPRVSLRSIHFVLELVLKNILRNSWLVYFRLKRLKYEAPGW